MRIISKKSYTDIFEKVLSGEKTFDMRVADFDCEPGDVLEQIEVDHDGQETGRRARHIVGTVLRTQDVDFWPAEDVDKHGYQVISLIDDKQYAEHKKSQPERSVETLGGAGKTSRSSGRSETLGLPKHGDTTIVAKKHRNVSNSTERGVDR